MKTISLSETAGLLNHAQRLVLCTHLQPDGDAIGSLLAATWLLKNVGKDVTPICHDPVPQNLRILPGWELVKSPAEVSGQAFDLFVSMDASDMERLGDARPLFQASPETLVIDHHTSNTLFGKYNYVDAKVAATGNLVFRLYQEMLVDLTPDSAACLYTAVSTDTGNFSFGQMDAEFFDQVSALMRAGLDIVTYSRALHLTKELNFIKLLGRALNSLTFYSEGKLTSMMLRKEDFAQTGASHEQTESLVNYALNIIGVKMCFLASEVTEKQTKFSFRALTPYKVSDIAKEFGGGGHLLAAGCTMDEPFDQAVPRVLPRMQQEASK